MKGGEFTKAEKIAECTVMYHYLLLFFGKTSVLFLPCKLD